VRFRREGVVRRVLCTVRVLMYGSGGRNTPAPLGKKGSEVELANIDRFDRESE
jgi:hypothetical protein